MRVLRAENLSFLIIALFSSTTLSHPLNSTTPDFSDEYPSVIMKARDYNPSKDPNLHCETSGASPPIVEVHEAANRILADSYDQWCTQSNFHPWGTKCTTLRSFKGAQISMCNGGRSVDTPCDEAAKTAKMIADNCVRADRKTGGYYEFIRSGFRIVVH